MTNLPDRAPARMYSWAPFERGHKVNLRHGAEDKSVLAPIADELRACIAEAAPWTSAAAFRPVVEAWAWAEAKCVAYRRWFDAVGLWTVDGDPQPGLTTYDRAEARAGQLREQLGLTPKSLVDILGKLASHEPEAMRGALEQLRATGAEIRQAAERRQIAVDPEASGG